MNYQAIRKLQKENGYWEMQELIYSGEAWKFEGSFGRAAMKALESGACMLGKTPRRDYYGYRIPSRDEVKPGSTGSFHNAKMFWFKHDHNSQCRDFRFVN